jgi:hypothetical protein
VGRRRRNDPWLDAACKAAIEEGKARAHEYLASAIDETLDPDDLPDPDTSPLPKVTIDQAIKIAQMSGPAGAGAAPPASPLASDAEVCAALVRSLLAFGVRVTAEREAWARLQLQCPDPNLLGRIAEVTLAAKGEGGMMRACPHCRQPVHLSFDREG